MKISAVIPTYNSAKFIAAAISSINAQTAPIEEIIVVDDGSTDNTEQVLAGLSGNIIYHKQVNQGPSAARNKAIELASGDWIALLDADDQWTPNKTRFQLDALRKNSALHFIFGDEAEIDVDGNIITPSSLDKHNLLVDLKKISGQPLPNALAALVGKNFVPTSSALFRRDTVLELGLFRSDIRFGEDLELWAKIAARHPVACVPEALIYRRKHSESATTATERMLSQLPMVMASIREHTRDQLIAQKVNPDAIVSDAYWTLGYWYFVNENTLKARQAFLQSLKEKSSFRSLLYFISCSLPQGAINRIKGIKQKINKTFVL
ncbi:glycosyltransferase family 2 protein [Methylomonas sp. MgM2]